MDMKAILDRITARRTALGLSETGLSLQAGSRDLIRNWRRALERDQDISARHDSLDAIAKALKVSTAWLVGEAEPAAPTPAAPPGMAEPAEPFTFAPQPVRDSDPQGFLRAIWGRAVTTPATYRLAAALPAFALGVGDVLIADLGRLPQPGELALVTIINEATATSITTVRRYLPPYLAGGASDADNPPLRIDQPGVTVRYPIVGALRGLPTSI
jgi:transcriptional regulator with XRE-family HTH domain